MSAQIEHRIKQLTLERRELEMTHYLMVQKKLKEDQLFQQQVGQNQSRFAQIQGALMELQLLKTSVNHEDTGLNALLRITTPKTERT